MKFSGKMRRFTEVRFASLLSGGFITAIQEVPAFRDFTIRDPRYFVILFRAPIHENPRRFVILKRNLQKEKFGGGFFWKFSCFFLLLCIIFHMKSS